MGHVRKAAIAAWFCLPLLTASPFQCVSGQNDRQGRPINEMMGMPGGARTTGAASRDTSPQSTSNCAGALPTFRGGNPEPAGQQDVLVGTSPAADPYLADRCLIDVATVGELSVAGQATIVDVRSAAGFDAYRIPGAINIPAYAIRTKTFLKAHHLVLVNAGRSHRRLLQVCQQLQETGFSKVSVMKGGLGAWRAHGGALAGNDGAADELSNMSPSQFLAVQDERRWVILDATSGTVSSWSDLGSQTVVPYTADQYLVRTLRFLQLDGESQGLGPAILVVTRNGEDLTQIRAFLVSQGVRNAYYLEGGMAGYQDYLATRRSLLARVERGRAPVARCSGS